jgi:hypothetical protein
MSSKYCLIYYFDYCPITAWERETNLFFHKWLVKTAKSLSRQYSLLEFGDFYNAGITGYLLFELNCPRTIEFSRFNLGIQYAKGEMLKEIIALYGRTDTPKGKLNWDAVHVSLEEVCNASITREDENNSG